MSFLPPGLGSLLGAESPETWEKRLREAAYTSPGGTRIKFLFVDVSRVGTKRGTAFEFSEVDGAYVQQKGNGPRRYPLRCLFSGPQCDLEATAFEAAIYEDGVGHLEHPRYGAFDVVPFGDVNRRDDLVTAANQAVVEATFWVSLADVYPSAQGHPRSEIETALGDFDVVAAQEFAAGTDLAKAAARASTASTIRALLREVSAALSTAADATASVRQGFADAQNEINLGMDVLIGQPLLLARQMADLVRAPARALAGIQSRLEGYGLLLDTLIASPAGRVGAGQVVTQSGLRLKRKNDLQVAQHLAMNSVGGMVQSALSHTFVTRPAVIEAAANISEQFETLVAWREQAYLEAGEHDDGGAYQRLRQAVALTAGFLVEASFTTARERRVTLDRPRTIIDLSAELYGAVDGAMLDLLITSNKLTGSEILELPRGRTIAYYPR